LANLAELLDRFGVLLCACRLVYSLLFVAGAALLGVAAGALATKSIQTTAPVAFVRSSISVQPRLYSIASRS